MRNHLAIAALAAACLFGADSLAAASPTPPETGKESMTQHLAVPKGVTVRRDIPYLPGAQPHQKLDLYLPDRAARPLPWILWIHGGGWMEGDKTRILVMFLVEHGYALASIDYRLSGEAIFPAQIRDAYAALAWVRAHAGEHGLDPDRYAVAGSSAGGHLASLLGTAANAGVKEFGAPQGLNIRAVLDFFGPSDLIAIRSQRDGEGATDNPGNRLIGADILDRPDLAKAASPLTYIDGGDPPFLILHGDRDLLVPFAQSRLLASSLKLAGVRAELVTVHGGGHGGAKFQSAEVQQKVLSFLREALAAP